MTDTSYSAPAPVEVEGNAGAPDADPVRTPADEFQDEFQAFMNSSLLSDEAPNGDANAVDGSADAPGSEGGDPASPPPTNPNLAQPVSPNAAPTAGNETPAAGTESDEEQLFLAQMLGLSEPQADPQPAPAAAPANEPPAAPTSYMPLPDVLNVPDELTSALFESEDPNQRKAALGSLLSNFGNAILALADKRMEQHHVPQSIRQFQSTNAAAAKATATQDDFFAAYPDLKNFRPVVAKAFAAEAARNPGAQYSPELRDKIGPLVRRTLTTMGALKAPAAAPAKPDAPAGRVAPVKQVGFEAGNARPAGAGQIDPNSPEALLRDLSQF